MPSANVLKDVTTEHNTNKQSEEVLVANEEDEQHTNKQSQEVPMQLPNYSPATDVDAQDSRKVMEDDTHNNNDTDVPEANHASSDSINSEAVSSTQVHQVHSPGPILKKVVTDDTEGSR